jgi:hypothetical protein
MQDALFGPLLDALEKSGEADNTVVIYTTDHRDYMDAHGLRGKGVPILKQRRSLAPPPLPARSILPRPSRQLRNQQAICFETGPLAACS